MNSNITVNYHSTCTVLWPYVMSYDICLNFIEKTVMNMTVYRVIGQDIWNIRAIYEYVCLIQYYSRHGVLYDFVTSYVCMLIRIHKHVLALSW
jgi:hypothetical protein